MPYLEFGQKVTFDQGYGETGVVLAHDDRNSLITYMVKGEEPYTAPLVAVSETGLAFVNENWESPEEALSLARIELEQSTERWDHRPDLPYRAQHKRDGQCEYKVGDFVTTALIGEWRIYPRAEKGVPAGCTWPDICRGVIEYLTKTYGL